MSDEPIPADKHPGLRRICIAGTGRAVPERVLTNDDLSKMVDTSDAWIRERTGIRTRHMVRRGTFRTRRQACACHRQTD